MCYLCTTVLLAVVLFAMLLSCTDENIAVESTKTESTVIFETTTESEEVTTQEVTTEEVTTEEITTEVVTVTEETVIPVLVSDEDFLRYDEDSPEYKLFDMFKNSVPQVAEEVTETSASETTEVTETAEVAETTEVTVTTSIEWRDGNAALFYKDIESGKTLVINGEKSFGAASMIKAVYIYTLLVSADGGLLDLDEIIVYKEDMFVEGTGRFKDVLDGSAFTVRELMSFTLRYSDNTAYSMLRKRYGTRFFASAMENAGVSPTSYSKWWKGTVTQYGEFFVALANYFASDSENAKWLKDEMVKSTQNVMLQNALYPDKVAHKYGWDNDAYCDGGVAFSGNGMYAVVFMSDLDGGSDYRPNTQFIYAAGDLIAEMRANDRLSTENDGAIAQ